MTCCCNFCAGAPCSFNTGTALPTCAGGTGAGPANTGPSLTCTLLSDTVGVAYRAFSARPTWLGGSGKPTIDPWTKNILLCQEKQSLIQAGANPCCAAKQAQTDVTGSLQSNCACPCHPAPSPISLEAWIILVIAGAIILIVATSVFAHRAVD